MAISRGDASDETREGAEARRVKTSLIDPDRALERRRAAEAVRKPDQHKDNGLVREAQAGATGMTSETSRQTEGRAEHASRQKGRTATAEAPKVGLDAAPERSGAVRPGETREQYYQRLHRELRGGPERLRRQLQQSDERARTERGAGAAERRNTIEQQRPADVPGDHPQAERIRREAEGQGDYVWVDRGVVDTKLSRINRKEYADVWETQKTHKYSKEEIDASLKSLPEVRSRLEKGISRDELRTLASSSDPIERQIGRTFVTYYESHPIKVDLSADGRATVENGRHRLAQAAHLGIDEVPIRIIEQTRKRTGSES